MIEEAFNKAQTEWVRRQLYGMNGRREGAEQSSGLVDDLQRLMKQQELTSTEVDKYYETESLPSDYLHFVRVDVKATADCCPERDITTYQAEEANVGVLLRDTDRNPSFEWGETFNTIVGNKIRVYSDSKFVVTKVSLVYYRMPVSIKILNCVNPSTGSVHTSEQSCEFNDDVAEILADETAAILAGDIEAINQYQRETQNSQRNS